MSESLFEHYQQYSDQIIGNNIFHHKVISSTMTKAEKLANQDCDEGTVVLADNQISGRGRLNRDWISAPGKDLLISIVLRPQLSQLRYVNMAATIAVADMARNMTEQSVSIKWPNDVRINEKKVAGILVESALDNSTLKHAIVGIGINVNSDPASDPNTGGNSTSLFMETGENIPIKNVFDSILSSMNELYSKVLQGFSLTQMWAGNIDTIGKMISVKYGDSFVEGIARGVDHEGNLIVTKPDGSDITLVGGEVTLKDTFTNT
jgi:BirA family biotin operon repressor/biotin-[acetyl-CoA-carboxylase] ligase